MSDLHMAAKHGDLFEEQDSQFDYGQKNQPNPAVLLGPYLSGVTTLKIMILKVMRQ